MGTMGCENSIKEESVLARTIFSTKGGRVKATTVKDRPGSTKSDEDVVRDIKYGSKKMAGEDYRERSLAIHGLICARCARQFDAANRHLLTVHHKDGNHHHNPGDGSNWENLCVYCHEDIHSRGLLGDFLRKSESSEKEDVLVYKSERQESSSSGLGLLGEKLTRALKDKNTK
jgi:hypothetical protein